MNFPLESLFQVHGGNPEYAAIFGIEMTSMTLEEGNCLSNTEVLCDIGSGHGFLLNGILEKAAKPGAKGIVGELPLVINEIKSKHKDANLLKNLEFVETDMFKEDVPADAYFLKHILQMMSAFKF